MEAQWPLTLHLPHSCLCSNYKSTPVNFSPPVYPLPHFFFHLGIPRHVLGPCHKCFGHMMGVRGYITCYKTFDTYYLACYIPLITRNMGVHGCKTWWGEKIDAKCRPWEKNCSNTLVLKLWPWYFCGYSKLQSLLFWVHSCLKW
jgi:hypothetical protein